MTMARFLGGLESGTSLSMTKARSWRCSCAHVVLADSSTTSPACARQYEHRLHRAAGCLCDPAVSYAVDGVSGARHMQVIWFVG